MTAQDPPRIEFPCDYPVKVLGRSVDQFRSVVLEVVERHAPGFDQDSVTLKASSKGRFVSINVTITATGPAQLQALHQDLLDTGLVQMVI